MKGYTYKISEFTLKTISKNKLLPLYCLCGMYKSVILSISIAKRSSGGNASVFVTKGRRSQISNSHKHTFTSNKDIVKPEIKFD